MMRKVMAVLVVGATCLVNVHGEESLAPLQDGKAPQTVTELWAGYDPRQEPLEIEVLKEWEEDGVVLRVVRYRIGIFKGQKAMMAAVYGYPITNYGAKVGDDFLNTTAIQSAIDACSKAGGGRVTIPEGRFVTGTIFLKDNVTVQVDQGAVLLGSTNLADYATTVRGAIEAPAFNRCLIYAYRAKNIGFTGKGLVDARGTPAAFPVKSGKQLGERPMLMRFVECENVSFKDLSFKNPASWGLHMVSCRNLHFEGIRMESKHNNTNNDGIDLDGCVDVLVEDCVIKSGDDALCLKSTTSQSCSNIVVRGCELSSDTAAVKLGTSSSVLYARHVSGLTVRNLEATFDKPDVRRPICVEDVEGMEQTGVVVH